MLRGLGSIVLASFVFSANGADSAGAPPNDAPWSVHTPFSSSLKYNDQIIFTRKSFDVVVGKKTIKNVQVSDGKKGEKQFIREAFEESTNELGAKTIRYTFEPVGFPANAKLQLKGTVTTSEEGLAAEDYEGEKRAKFIRLSVGRSSNLRNNTVYDRKFDWSMGFGPQSRIKPAPKNQWIVECSGEKIELTFKPRFYQKHKNIRFFEPWTYKVRQDSVTGWSSWWAYFDNIKQTDIDALVDVFDRKQMRDFGYRFIQIDDGFQQHPKGTPENWHNWRSDTFPSGMKGYVKSIVSKGFEAAVWMGVTINDEKLTKDHPDWFVPAADVNLQKGPWIDWVIDATNPQAVDQIIKPLFKGFKDAGFTYVKIDALRHLLYDGYYHAAPGHFESRSSSAELAYRSYVKAAREVLGRETFVLSCWGVLPEGVGVFDACRLGGDGYGPATMQQYNSWNGIVWRSDPDHCDVLPRDKGTVSDTVVRPVLASMAGAMLLVSDKPSVYEKDENLEGMKRSSPVLFSVPGQLYDYDPRKSSALVSIKGHRQETGGPSGPIDADQYGEGCEWWLQEIARPFETWNVLARFAWDKPVNLSTAVFADFGLDPTKEYLVYEFWSRKFMGSFKGSFNASSQKAKTVCIYAIHEKLARPQLISTSRHISQGGVDLVAVKWTASSRTLLGKSKVIKGDPYEMVFHVPAGYTVGWCSIDGVTLAPSVDGQIARVRFVPKKTKTVVWSVSFN